MNRQIERDIRICPCCNKEVERGEMDFTRDCHGIAFRLVCFSCWEKLMRKPQHRSSVSLKVLTYHFPPIISQTSHRLCECLFCCLCLYITICTVHVNSLLKKISKIMKKNIDKIENKRYNNIIKNREVLR